jgi:AraC-like DNA-binding protein
MFILSISENALLFVSGLGIVQAFLLSCLLIFHPKSDKTVNLFLGLYIISISLPMFMPLLQYFFSWQVISIVDPFIALVGPFLYLYVISFKKIIRLRKVYPHFLLFLLNILVDWWFYQSISSKYPYTKQFSEEALNHPFFTIVVCVRLVQMTTYYFLSIKALSNYQNSIRQLFSETSRIDLKWVRWLINGYMFLIIMWGIVYFFIQKFPGYFDLLTFINSALITPYIYTITFKSISQSTLWQIQSSVNKNDVEAQISGVEKTELQSILPEKDKISKPALNHSKTDEIAARVVALMEKESLYQETELTLQQLAQKLQLPAYQVSQAINEGLKKNFYDLVNGYRVEKAKRLLMNPENKKFTVLSVGFEAGFNSKTTFNTVFKKFTGLTPTDFRDKQNTMAS